MPAHPKAGTREMLPQPAVTHAHVLQLLGQRCRRVIMLRKASIDQLHLASLNQNSKVPLCLNVLCLSPKDDEWNTSVQNKMDTEGV